MVRPQTDNTKKRNGVDHIAEAWTRLRGVLQPTKPNDVVAISPIIYVETKEKILDPELLGDRSYRTVFEANPDAQAIWVWLPWAHEPFRVPWQKGMYGNVPTSFGRDKPKSKSKKQKKAA